MLFLPEAADLSKHETSFIMLCISDQSSSRCKKTLRWRRAARDSLALCEFLPAGRQYKAFRYNTKARSARELFS